MDLLEREQFLDKLGAIRNEVVCGQGHLVLVSGEAGIGKTSLVESFARDYQRVHATRCSPLVRLVHFTI